METINYNVLVETLRKKKDLSMKDICGDYMSHSSYSRFVSKNQSLSIDRLLYILHRMDLSFREAGLFDHNIQATQADNVLMSQVLLRKNQEEMAKLAEEFQLKSNRDYDIYGMMAIQVNLEMGGETRAKQIKALKDYLFHVNDWDYKEMYLFSFILHQSSSTVIMSIINRLYKRAAEPLYLEHNLNLIILIAKAHLEYLKRQELDCAKTLLEKLNNLTVNKTFHTIQAYATINQALHQYVSQRIDIDYQKIKRLHRNFKEFDSPFLANRLQENYSHLKQIYDLPSLEDEENG